MKICFINPSVGITSGGSESFIYNIALYLSKKHEVMVLTGKSFGGKLQRNMNDAPFKIKTIPFLSRKEFKSVFSFMPYKFQLESLTFYYSFRFYILCNPSFREELKEFDIISTHFYLDSILFSRYFSNLGIPCVLHIPGDVHIKNFFDYDQSSMYIANSQTTKDLIWSKYGVAVRGVVTPGIPPNIFKMSFHKIDMLNDKKILLYVGRLDKRKGLHKLLQIFENLYKKHNDLVLVIVGEGMLRKELEMIAHNGRKWGKKVIFAGQVSYNEIFSYYSSADILVHATEHESFGMTVLEAMAMGLPVVASDIPALREVTNNIVPLLPKEDLTIWIETIDKLLKDEYIRKELGDKERLHAREQTWSKKANEYELYLKEEVHND